MILFMEILDKNRLNSWFNQYIEEKQLNDIDTGGRYISIDKIIEYFQSLDATSQKNIKELILELERRDENITEFFRLFASLYIINGVPLRKDMT